MLRLLPLLSAFIITIQSMCPKARLAALQQILSSGGTTFETQLDPLLSDPYAQQLIQSMQGQQLGMNSLNYGSQIGMSPYGVNNYGMQSFPRFAPQINPAMSQLGMSQIGYGNQLGGMSQLGYGNQLGYGSQLGYGNQLMGAQMSPSLMGYGNQMYGNSLYGQQGYGNRAMYGMRMPFNAEKKTK